MILQNRPYDTLSIGDSAELRRLCTVEDLIVFANASGNHNPAHLAMADINHDGRPDAWAPALWVGSLISAVLGNMLPGPGAIYRAQDFRFTGRAQAGDELLARVEVLEKLPESRVRLSTTVRRVGDGAIILEGVADVVAPTEPLRFEDAAIPGLILRRHVHFDALIARAEPLPPIPTAVVAPEDEPSLGGALLGRDHTLIAPVLVGRRSRIEAAAEALDASLTGVEIVDVSDPAQAADAAAKLVRDGRAQALMKGKLHTDDLLRAVLAKENGLRTRRRLSHVFVMDVPGMAHPLLVTDAAINIAPDLRTKADIVQNAIDLARSLGIEQPKVGVLSAIETVNPDLPSSVDGALLAKMAERGQITGGLVDGPLAMDNAVSVAAARIKGIHSPVAGHAEILVAPDLDAGNMLAKQLTHIAGAEGAGVVLGARAPIVLTSRADDDKARLASCAVAAIHAAAVHGAMAE
jgi:phosphate butyryltransferase